jgi:hypothetical protein
MLSDLHPARGGLPIVTYVYSQESRTLVQRLEIGQLQHAQRID